MSRRRCTEYYTWQGMRNRCNSPRNKDYKFYGGRGITVCARWDSFENFLADMGQRPAGKFLDRRNNEKGYSKSNCRWVTQIAQQNNRRSNRRVMFRGKLRTIADIGRLLGIKSNTLVKRLDAGWRSDELRFQVAP